MANGSEWRAIFENWPASLPRQGLLATSFQEAIPFVDFRLSESMILLERDRPDTAGTRKVIIPFDEISALKLPDPGDLAKYGALGFEASR